MKDPDEETHTTETVDDRPQASPRRRAHPEVEKGARIGRYVVVDQLGAGGMGVVYRARDGELERDVALKLVTTEAAEGESHGRARLLREAQALAQLAHPNVIAIFDVGRFEGGVFLAMELVEGQRLDQWLKAERRDWRAVVQIFRDAGRGLQAAHAAGLVHRDFKPTNVMVGVDGRVRVLDFGLARPPSTARRAEPPRASGGPLREDHPTVSGGAAAEEPRSVETAAPVREQSPTSSGSNLLLTPVTQVGAIVGTPPYMAPEQHLGMVGDAKADQFSYCIAFYQALYGERPFSGATLSELIDNVTAGRLRPPPPGVRVPGWVREIILRGLSVAPEARWPSMDALLEALGRDPAIARRRLAMTASAVGLVGLALFGIWRGTHGPRRCTGADGEVTAVWSAARRTAIESAFLATGTPYAADAFATVVRGLDAYARNWSAMRTEACEATHVRGTQSTDVLDLRSECLDSRLEDLRAQLEVFSSADAALVERAAQTAQSLPSLAQCADAQALRAPVRPPADPALRKKVDEVRKEVAQVRALLVSGRYPAGLKRAVTVAESARTTGWRPIEAEALLYLGQLQEYTGDYPTALKTIKDAGVAAESGRHDVFAARAWISLVWVTGERLGKYADAQELAREAQAKVERVGRDEELSADLESKLAALACDQGKYADGLAHARKALALREKVMQPDDTAVGAAVVDVADALSQLGKFDEAVALYRRAAVIVEKTGGPLHPLLASTLSNLAASLREKGSYEEALAQYHRAEKIVLTALGPEHNMLGTVYVNVGGILRAQRKYDEALVQYRHALALWTKLLGAEHPNVGTVHFHLGSTYLLEQRPADALVELRHALAIWEKSMGPDHPSLSAALCAIGDALMLQKDPRAAVKSYQRGVAVLEKAVGPDHPDLAEGLTGLGLARLQLGGAREAVALLERALKIRQASGGDPLDLARTRFALARALRAAGGDVERAHALAESARQAYATHDGARADAAAVTAWLSSP